MLFTELAKSETVFMVHESLDKCKTGCQVSDYETVGVPHSETVHSVSRSALSETVFGQLVKTDC